MSTQECLPTLLGYKELWRSNGVQPNFYVWGGREIGRGEGGIEGGRD